MAPLGYGAAVTWVWIIAATGVASACGAVLSARRLRAKSAALSAQLTTLVSTATAARAQFDRVGHAPASANRA